MLRPGPRAPAVGAGENGACQRLWPVRARRLRPGSDWLCEPAAEAAGASSFDPSMQPHDAATRPAAGQHVLAPG